MTSDVPLAWMVLAGVGSPAALFALLGGASLVKRPLPERWTGSLAAGAMAIACGALTVALVVYGAKDTGAQLARLLPALEIASLDAALGQRAGVLLGRSRMTDVIDAALVLLAADGDSLLTSDPADLGPLAVAAGLHVDIVPV